MSFDNAGTSYESYIQAVLSECRYFAGIVGNAEPAGTLYLGGGTPSLLEPALIERLTSGIDRIMCLDQDCEVTIEVNPGTVDEEKLAGYMKAGVNRISLGVQSTDDESLRLLGRIHNAAQGREAYEASRRAGFENVGIDLIFGLPGQTEENWAADLRRALAWKPDHVSAYMLKPPSSWEPPEDEIVAAMYLNTVEELEKQGLFQYEVSNFARRGKKSRHNCVYWNGKSYLGLGVSAHSYMALPYAGFMELYCEPADEEGPVRFRWWNDAELDPYLENVVQSGHSVAQIEQITKKAALDEAIMLGLRLKEGVDPDYIEAEFGKEAKKAFENAALEITEMGFGEASEGRFRLKPEGMLLADELAARIALKVTGI